MENIKISSGKNEEKIRKITMPELLKNNGEKGKPLWVMIHSKIYDVSKFKHPGGRSLLINDDDDHYEDKGIEFDSVNHSKEAIEELEKFYIGDFVEGGYEDTEKTQIEEKKDCFVELQPVGRTYMKEDEEINNKKDHFRAFMLTCIIVFLILLLIITF
jgi:cytochrome b involved in lipid metabolism